MATVKSEGLKAVFITLTYGQNFPAPREAKRHLDNFIKRLRRKHDGLSGFWRLEFQKRGAPHFHLLLFNLPFIPKGEIAYHWGEIIGERYMDTSSEDSRVPFTRIELLQSHTHASRYVAKYVAKREGNGGFNVASYLTAEGEFIHPLTGEVSKSVGRYWGVINKECIPFADMAEIGASGVGIKALMTLKGALAAIYWRVDASNRYGFFLFLDSPYTWADYFEECLQL